MTYGTKLKIFGGVIGKSLIFGLSILFTGRIAQSSDVLDLLSMRFLVSTIFLLIFRVIGIIKVDFKDKNLKLLLLAAVLQPVIYYLAEATGIANSSTGVSGTMLSLISVAILIGERLILKYKFDAKTTLFVLIKVAGAIIISAAGVHSGSTSLLGIVFLLVTIVTDTLYVLYLKKLTLDFSPMEITYFTAILGAVVFNSANVIRHFYNNTITHYFDTLTVPENLIGLIYLGLGATIIAMSLTNYMMKHIKPSYMSAFGGLSTIITIAAGVIFNNEILGVYQIIGIVFLLTGAVGAAFVPQTNNVDSKQQIIETKEK